jgi:uncharacterized protein (TIGR02271 family)
MQNEQFAALRGRSVIDLSGDEIGKVQDIYLDDATQQPEWVAVAQGRSGKKSALVPLQGARVGNEISVPYSKDQVKATPDIDAKHIDETTEQKLYAHYGLDYSEARSDSGLPTGTPAANEGSVVRSEQELSVSKERISAGHVRLRKWVETEPVTETVQLQQEVARVEREPINAPASSGEIGEQEIEVELQAERPVVQKQTIARERVSLSKDVEVDEATISDELQKERVEVDGDHVDRA